MSRPIRGVLIANRGEIACRIARTCRRLGVRAVAVATPADRDALHARTADLTVPLDPASAPAGYRDVDGLLAAARRVGADAVHPGYGFLAENADFARAVEAAGLTFVGPPAAAIAAMGDKSAAKRLAREAGVPVLPGVEESAEDAAARDRDAALIGAAGEIPGPLLVKAAAGGGGKGMRRVDRSEALPEAIAETRREAAALFGSDRLLVERYVAQPRHVEVQVLADHHGNLLHLHDRDCSLQRRHQKLLEEAPAPDLSPDTRATLHDAALALARAIDYRNAGTVEFILDAATGEVFFLEMNTRLQVEHPVSEAVLGLDLVEWQLRVAAGEALAFRQAELVPRGCAVEARLNAEDPARDFAPAAGRLALVAPPSDPDLRVDAGVASGDAIATDYDSLVAKLIVHAPDRATAMARLAGALRDTAVFGVPTTGPLLAQLLADPEFAARPATTHYLAERWPDGWPGADVADPDRADALLWAAACVCCMDTAVAGWPASPWQSLRLWRVGGDPPVPGRAHLILRGADGRDRRLWAALGPSGEGTIALKPLDATDVDWVPLTAAWVPDERDGGHLTIGGEAIGVRRLRVLRQARTVHVDDGFGWTAFDWLAPEHADLSESAEQAGGDGRLSAPMPGRVQSVEVTVGDAVAAGDAILVLESMKMFHTVTAPAAGTIRSLSCAAGEAVTGGQLLAEIAPDAARAE